MCKFAHTIVPGHAPMVPPSPGVTMPSSHPLGRRQFLAVSVLTPLGAMLATNTAQAAGHTFTFAANGDAFLLDGQPLQIRSGEMHPARIPTQYWRHRIQMAKAMGMNTVAV